MYFKIIINIKIIVDKRIMNIKIKKNKWFKMVVINFYVIFVFFFMFFVLILFIDVMIEGVLVNLVMGVFLMVFVLLDFKW